MHPLYLAKEDRVREVYVWRAILAVFALTAVAGLAASLDPGFMPFFGELDAIPVATGERIEFLMTSGALPSGKANTDIYFLEKDGTFHKVSSFEDVPVCVTDYEGQLFVTFLDRDGGGGPSSIFKDGKWVRSISGPVGFSINDVVSLGGNVYALSVSDDGDKLTALVLGESGWRQAGESFETGVKVAMAGWTRVGGHAEVLYAVGPEDALGGVEPRKARWFTVAFEGSGWGTSSEVTLPAPSLPRPCEYEGALALVLVPVGDDNTVRVVQVEQGKLEPIAEVSTEGKRKITGAWLAQLAGEWHVFLFGPGRLWDVPLDGGKAGEARQLLAVDQWALLRSNIYVALMLLGAVMLVALGAAWLVMRIRGIVRGGENTRA